MRKVVVNAKPSVVSIEDVTGDKCYGFILEGNKGFITRKDGFRRGDYCAKAVNSLTEGNCWSMHTSPTLHGVIQGLVKAKFAVYEFETPEEMLKYLAKTR